MSRWVTSLGGGRRAVVNVVANTLVGVVQDQEAVEIVIVVVVIVLVGILEATTQWIIILKMEVIGIAAT